MIISIIFRYYHASGAWKILKESFRKHCKTFVNWERPTWYYVSNPLQSMFTLHTYPAFLLQGVLHFIKLLFQGFLIFRQRGSTSFYFVKLGTQRGVLIGQSLLGWRKFSIRSTEFFQLQNRKLKKLVGNHFMRKSVGLVNFILAWVFLLYTISYSIYSTYRTSTFW